MIRIIVPPPVYDAAIPEGVNVGIDVAVGADSTAIAIVEGCKVVLIVHADRNADLMKELLGGGEDQWRDFGPTDLLAGEIGRLDCGIRIFKSAAPDSKLSAGKNRGPGRSRNAKRVW